MEPNSLLNRIIGFFAPGYYSGKTKFPDPISPKGQYVPPQVQTEIPKLTPDTKLIMDSPIATESAQKYMENIMNNYVPKTPDVPQGWKTPLLPKANTMAKAAWENKLHPALQVLMAIAETQLMRPAASGTPKFNPYNVMGNTTKQELYDYSQHENPLDYALEKWPRNITKEWKNNNIVNWRKDPTLSKFVYAYNPSDNPKMELDNIMQIINQLDL